MTLHLPPGLRAPLIVAVLVAPFLPYYHKSTESAKGTFLGSVSYAGPILGLFLLVSIGVILRMWYGSRVKSARESREVSRRVDYLFSFLLLFPIGFCFVRTDTALLDSGALVTVKYGYGAPNFSPLMYFAAVYVSVVLQRLMIFKDAEAISPNKTLEPTATSVTPPASAGVAPAAAVAHH